MLGKTRIFSIFIENDSIFSIIKALLAVLFALIIVFFILLFTGYSPLPVYGALLQGAFGSKRCIGETLISTTPLLFSGLGFALAYRCGLFNIGLEGQITMGGIAAAFFGFIIPEINPVLHVIICIMAGALAGAFWGFIPGYLKAKFGIHEVIGVIMLNHIAFKIAAYLVSMQGPMQDKMDDMPASPFVQESARIVRFARGSRLHWGIFLAIAVAGIVWLLLFRTRLGFKIRAVGMNSYAAETAGISIKKHIVLTMAMSGALGGLAGAVEILGVHYRLFAAFSPGYGFDAIAVALLGLVNPIGIIASSFLFGVLRSGSVFMQAMYGVNKDMVSVITGIIVFFMGMSIPIGILIRNRLKRSRNGTLH
ncbi:MAG: ABC transporter permease [Spirochaetales bacterium]|nr:ABC transporter permease [Spirochaetales bacterium]